MIMVLLLVAGCQDPPESYLLEDLRFSRVITTHHPGGTYHSALGIMELNSAEPLAGLSVRFDYIDSQGRAKASSTKHFGPMKPHGRVIFTCDFICRGWGLATPVWLKIRDPAFR